MEISKSLTEEIVRVQLKLQDAIFEHQVKEYIIYTRESCVVMRTFVHVCVDSDRETDPR